MIHGSIHIWVTAHLGESPSGLAWCLPQVFAYYLLLTIISISLSFTDIRLWLNMSFFAEKVDRWGKDMASLWENFNICPQLHWLELPCHSQEELFSKRSLKVWGDAQKPHPDIAYLLVWVEDTKRDRCYGISLVWVHPNEVRVATMKEVVEN